jgi:hypothetical protein
VEIDEETQCHNQLTEIQPAKSSKKAQKKRETLYLAVKEALL